MFASKLYTSKQIKSAEQKAMEQGFSADQLMENAGRAALACLKNRFPHARRLLVFCGSGNNAGDGYVLARLAQEQGFSVLISQYKALEELPDTARHAAVKALDAGIECQCIDDPPFAEIDLIVDALLGTGLHGVVRAPIEAAITQINDSRLPVLSLDVPSGLNSDTGQVMGCCVKATVTLAFMGLKLGLFTLDGPDYSGDVLVNDLGARGAMQSLDPIATLLPDSLVSERLLPRAKNVHKGDFGHVLALGGNLGMPGAIYLAAMAALRVGAGLVTIGTHPDYAASFQSGLPEALVYGVSEGHSLSALLEKATVCLIGPGLGQDKWAVDLFNQVIASPLPMVVDASALHFLAANPQHDDAWVLTPHPGEAACLLQCSTDKIQANRYQALTALQKKFGGNVVLKGVGSLVKTDKQDTFVCAAGNPGMASPGMGDVLTGIIAGLIAQGFCLSEAATLGVLLHAKAGDNAANAEGERGLLASDLMPYLRRLVNECVE